MFHSRFLLARDIALADMSIPRIVRWAIYGDESEWRRRGMQPVPVHKSRILRDLAFESARAGSVDMFWRMSRARFRV